MRWVTIKSTRGKYQVGKTTYKHGDVFQVDPTKDDVARAIATRRLVGATPPPQPKEEAKAAEPKAEAKDDSKSKK